MPMGSGTDRLNRRACGLRLCGSLRGVRRGLVEVADGFNRRCRRVCAGRRRRAVAQQPQCAGGYGPDAAKNRAG